MVASSIMSTCSLDWTATGTMIQAVATLGALAVATYAGWKAKDAADAAWKAVNIERGRDARQEERDLSVQASRVYCTPVEFAPKSGTSPRVAVVNASDLPVYNVRVSVDDPQRGHLDVLDFGHVLPTHSPHRSATAQSLERWGWHRQPDHRGNDGQWMNFEGEPPDLVPTLTFTDSNNEVWEREPSGRLRRLTEERMRTPMDPSYETR